MSHVYNKIWIHAVWATKERQLLIQSQIEHAVHNFLRKQLTEMVFPLRIINRMPDHIHCLFILNPNKSISEVVKQIKGSSSHYINQNNLTTDKFSWQTGYGAFAVSESVLDKVFVYI